MPRAVVVLPSTTYRARDFVSAAETLGIELVVVSEQPAPFDMGNRYLRVDCSNTDAAAEAIVLLGEDVPIDGIVAADDAGVLIAAMAGTKLGLPSNRHDAAEATRDKGLQREKLARAEVPQPRFVVVGPKDDAATAALEVGYPLILKPTKRSASQGVVKVDQPNDLLSRLTEVRRIVGSHETLLVEEFMPGDEVAIEGVVSKGLLTTLAIFDKPDTRGGPFFPETIMVTPSRHSARDQDEIRRVAEAAVKGLGLTQGPVHVELRLDGGVVRVIEVAARSIGGLCSRSLSFGLMNTTLETLILRNAIGLEKPELKRENTASGVLMLPVPRSGRLRSVDGVTMAREIKGITGIDIMMKQGEQVMALPEGDRYLGFVFAKADEPEEVETALRSAMSTIIVTVD
jgi:biotin carboxylase